MSIENYGDFQKLPEDCIAKVLSLMTPKDACRLSSVNSTFRSAMESDVVWERLLPPDCRHIISRSIDGADSLLAKFRTKKELYLHLCHNPILIDGSTKSFSLEKGTGKKCFMLASRDFSIIWGDTPRWQWIPFPNSRFPEVAVRLVGHWFQIRGEINTAMLSSRTKYAAYLVFTLRSEIDGYGHQLAMALIEISGQESDKQTICLQIGRDADGTTVYFDPDLEQKQRCQTVPRPKSCMHVISHVFRRPDILMPPELMRYPKFRDDGWMEVELGEFFVEGKQGQLVKIISRDWNCGDWRNCCGGGHLIIQGIDIRPRAW